MELKEAKITNYYNLTFGTDQGSDKALVSIPHYQRPYRWPPEYINTLINDWLNEEKGNYFTGSIVTVKKDSGIIHQLIDGQQRYTTVFLVNFVCFLITRLAIREALLYRRSRVSGLLDSLLTSATYLYGEFDKDNFEELKENILEKIDSFEDAKNADKEVEIQEQLLELFFNNMYLPTFPEGKSDYKYEYKKLLSQSFEEKSIKLSYDRTAFNIQLKTALTNSLIKLDSQNEQTIEFIEVDESPIVTQYMNSIKTIFDHFTEISGNSEDEPLLKAINTIKTIEKFMKEVNFCVIQTGSVNDAYTLFEVLNDRALSLDDLDLIKNQFYKRYCLSNKSESERHIDKVIESREEQWGEHIFPDGIKQAHKPLITYIFSSFYSGETDYLLQSSEKNRLKITNYLNSRESYQDFDFLKDFNTLEAATTFVHSFDIWHKSKNKRALKAEYSVNNTATEKLVHLLAALGQFGVLVGLTNVIFKYIEVNISQNFEPKLVNQFFNELIGNSDSHIEIHKLSKRIWKLVMQAPSAEAPREYAVSLIKNNHINSNGNNFIESDFITKQLESELESWLENWLYNKNDIKICILFARLIKSSSKEIEQNEFKKTLSDSEVEKLHLDHMEPSNVPGHNQSKYFESEDRQLIVNGLGNMFPLPGSLNISKSNQPFIEAFGYLEKSGLGDHWLVKETRIMFEENNLNNIPNQEFFRKRKTFLIKLFYEVVVSS
ncbi:DUF262 domain-containing protein [Photobacterium leiognathi]|uniref:DUF262 domain-containing protein n=1 Tax=Photobacterium leiognathi TaxID=553611 RepID=UPI002981C16F|nr:DUF262 domain-containing protein [Photobacterium leiognathi]